MVDLYPIFGSLLYQNDAQASRHIRGFHEPGSLDQLLSDWAVLVSEISSLLQYGSSLNSDYDSSCVD